jgi:light-regulated signal transduction histidine kinase (bacteriophytochrome)
MNSENNPQNSEEQLNKLKKDFEEFVYIVSHDLKAPLRAVKNLSEWIEEDLAANTSEDIKKNLALLRGRTEWMNRMLDGLLDYSRVSSKRQTLQNLKVESLIKTTIESLDIPRNFEIALEVKKQEFFADHSQFKTVLECLIQNAVKFNKNESPKITIKAEEIPGGLELTVADNGLGIDHDNPQIAFELFKTLHRKEKMYSVGIGLAIVKKIMENVNGKVSLDTVSGEGTTLKTFWPNSTQ